MVEGRRKPQRTQEDTWSGPTRIPRRRFESTPHFYESEEAEERALGRTRPRRQDSRSGTYEYDYGPRRSSFRGSDDDERDWEAGRLRWYDEGERMGYTTPPEFPRRRGVGWESEDVERPRGTPYGYGGITRRDEETYYGRRPGTGDVYARRGGGEWEGAREAPYRGDRNRSFERSGNWSRNMPRKTQDRHAGDVDEHYGAGGSRRVGNRMDDKLDTVRRMRRPGRGGLRQRPATRRGGRAKGPGGTAS